MKDPTSGRVHKKKRVCAPPSFLSMGQAAGVNTWGIRNTLGMAQPQGRESEDLIERARERDNET